MPGIKQVLPCTIKPHDFVLNASFADKIIWHNYYCCPCLVFFLKWPKNLLVDLWMKLSKIMSSALLWRARQLPSKLSFFPIFCWRWLAFTWGFFTTSSPPKKKPLFLFGIGSLSTVLNAYCGLQKYCTLSVFKVFYYIYTFIIIKFSFNKGINYVTQERSALKMYSIIIISNDAAMVMFSTIFDFLGIWRMKIVSKTDKAWIDKKNNDHIWH